jgi:hypothetical protein
MARRITEEAIAVTGNAAVDAIGRLMLAVVDLAETQRLTSIAMAEITREQRITNLIVRSQITADPAEKATLLDEARLRMDASRRHGTVRYAETTD